MLKNENLRISFPVRSYRNITLWLGYKCFPPKNNEGKTPLDVASQEDDDDDADEIKQYLLQLQNEDMTKETITNKDPCVICMGPKNGFYALVPCGHASLCEDCCKKITKDKFGKCPTCRKPCKSHMKIFFQASE